MTYNKDIKGKLYRYFIAQGMREYVRGWLKGTCPDCGRVDKFGVNLGMNRTNCFVCGYHPTPINLIIERQVLSTYREAWTFLKAYEGKAYIEPLIERIEVSDVQLPKGYVNIALGNSMQAKNIRRYVKRRGFKISDVSLKGWGYCIEGDYLGYLIIPFHAGGRLVYFNGRRVMGSGPKYMNPTIDEFGVGKSMIMYNTDALALYNRVYLTEGAINADTIGDNAMATGGKKIADYQVSMVLKSDVEEVVIILDPDALEDTLSIAMMMVYHKKIKVVTWEGEQDVNDIGKKETMKRVRKSPWIDYGNLLSMKHNLEYGKRTKPTYY